MSDSAARGHRTLSRDAYPTICPADGEGCNCDEGIGDEFCDPPAAYAFPLDIPTALTRDESELLQEIAEGKYVLEIGALLGYSTVTLARAARWVVSIDPHEGYPEHDPRPTLDTYLENLRRNAITNVVPVIARWQDAFAAIAPPSFDVVFMDLTGLYEDTKELLDHLHSDFATGLLGAIAVHDCGHPDWPGVQRAVEEFHNETGADMTVVDRLAVFQ